MKPTGKAGAGITVTFVNEVTEADVWIMPQTEKNLKTSLWGTPSFSGLKPGERGKAAVEEAEAGAYLIRIIDADHAYYAARDLPLENGDTVVFRTEDTRYEASLTILDKAGEVKAERENVFEGMLGAK